MLTTNEAFWLKLLTAKERETIRDYHELSAALDDGQISWAELGKRAETHWGFSVLTSLDSIQASIDCTSPSSVITVEEHSGQRYQVLSSPEQLNEIEDENDPSLLPVLTTPSIYRQLQQRQTGEEPIRKIVHDPSDKYLDECLRIHKQLQASDWHLEAKKGFYRSRARIHGKLTTLDYFPPALANRLLQAVRLAASIPLDKVPYGLEGQFTRPHLNLSIRIVIIPTRYGPEIVLRFLPLHPLKTTLRELGMSDTMESNLLEEIQEPGSILLFCGSTGSGKSTSLHCLLNRHLKSRAKVLSVEDPVEIPLDGISQVSVNHQKGVTFATATKAFLRQSPDIIYIGEIRDAETAAIVYEASLCGHRILSTIHSHSAQGVIARLQDLSFPTKDPLLPKIIIITQRLIPIPCPHCIEPQKDYCPTCKNTQRIGRKGIFSLSTYKPS